MYLYVHANKADVAVVFGSPFSASIHVFIIGHDNNLVFFRSTVFSSTVPDSALYRHPRLCRDLIKVPFTVV